MGRLLDADAVIFETMSDETALDTYNNLPWIKAIIVCIDLPEV